jgi:branched-chain amino acid transport system permease protein
MSPADAIIQAAASGLLMGSVYALIAVGFTIVFGVMRIVNFAHGHLVMVTMFASYAAYKYLGLDPYLSVLLLFPAFFVIGTLLYRILIAPILEINQASQYIATIGLFIFLENGINLMFGGDIRSVSLPYASHSVVVGTLALPITRLIAAGGSVVAIAALWAFLRFARLGAEIRATADNRLGALVIGVPIGRVFIGAFGLATATAALAGVLLMPFYLVNPSVGNDFMLRAFVISILGGLGSVPGALVAGLIVGLIEAAGTMFFAASIGNVLVFGLVIIIILVRPSGLFARAVQ